MSKPTLQALQSGLGFNAILAEAELGSLSLTLRRIVHDHTPFIFEDLIPKRNPTVLHDVSTAIKQTNTDSPPADPQSLSVERLEKYHWSAVNTLPGLIDSSDYKSHIFGPLNLERLPDRFEEDVGKLIKQRVPEKYARTDPCEH